VANEKLHNLYCSPSIIIMIKPRRTRWPGVGLCSMHMGEEECIQDFAEKAGWKKITRTT
jgi:hypothetical protein